MAYDLKCSGIRITIWIWASPVDDTGWQAEAVAKNALPPAQILEVPAALQVVHGIGSSRSDALLAVETAWCAELGAGGCPALNWQAIRDCLAVVRAI